VGLARLVIELGPTTDARELLDEGRQLLGTRDGRRNRAKQITEGGNLLGRNPIGHPGSPSQGFGRELGSHHSTESGKIKGPGLLAVQNQVKLHRGWSGRGCRGLLLHHLAHCGSHSHPDSCGPESAGILGRFFHRVGGLKLGVVLEVPDGSHAGALVDGLLHLFGQADVFDPEVRDLQANFFKLGSKSGLDLAPELAIASREIDDGDSCLGDTFAEFRDDLVADVGLDLFDGELPIRPGDLLQELSGVAHPDGIGAKRPDSDHSEVGISHHHRVHRPPFQIRESLGVDEVDLGLERTIESVLPSLQSAEDGQVLGLKFVSARLEGIGDRTLGDKDRHLRLSNRELRSILDLIAVSLKAINHRVLGVVQPLDDVDEFAADLVPNAHSLTSAVKYTAVGPSGCTPRGYPAEMRCSIALAFVALFALIGCSGGGGGGFSQRAQQGKENTFRYPIPTSPTTLDPHKVEDGDTIDLLQQTFEGLVGWNSENQVAPKLAEKWEIKDNGSTYVFTLRAGVKFHNGRELTADDVKWSYERVTNPKLASPVAATYLSDIVGVKEKLAGTAPEVTGIKVLTPQTVEFRLTRPVAFFLAKLTYLTGAILPKESVPADSDIRTTEQMVGTGPFKAARYTTDQLFELEAYDAYWGGKPKLARIERPVIKDAATRLLKYKNGEIDLISLERPDVEPLQRDEKFKDQIRYFPRAATWYVGFAPNAYEPFKNREVRRAFAMAIDPEEIVRDVLGGVNQVALGVLPPQIPGFREKPNHLPFDPAEAKRVLAAAGYPDGKGLPPLLMNFRDGRPDVEKVAVAVQAQIKKNLGVEVTLGKMEWTAYLAKRDKGGLQMFHMRWGADYLDPENFLTLLLTTNAPENKMGYSNPEVDRLCAEADIMPAGPERDAKYAQAEDLILQDAPWRPIYFQRDAELISPRVKGLTESVFGHLPHVNVELVAQP